MLFHSLLQGSQSIAILTHTNPDGDAIGSSGALRTIISKVYPEKEVRAFTPNDYPTFLKWNATATGIEVSRLTNSFIENCDLIIISDLNSFTRLEHLENSLNKNKSAHRVLIDHHENPDTSTIKVAFHDADASSTCFLVYNLIKAAGWWEYVDSTIASSAFCGMITDTGGFSYSNLTPDLFRAAAELIEKGANPVKIHQLVFDNESESRMRLRGYLLSKKMKLIPDHKAGYITFNLAEKTRFNYTTGDTEGIVNMPMSISGIETSALFSQTHDYIKVSLRSQSENIDVNAMCRKWFNGGGHFNAAGGRFYGTMKQAVETYRKAIEEI